MTMIKIIICGVGGQGILTASRLICEAAFNTGLDVKSAEVHGLSQRGGAMASSVKIGKRVFSPVIDIGEADYIISLEELETVRNIDYLRRNGVVVYSKRRIPPLTVIAKMEEYPEEEQILSLLRNKTDIIYALDVSEIDKKYGPRFENTYLIGFFSKLIEKLIPENCFKKALREIIPKEYIETNLKVFTEGRRAFVK